MPDKHPDPDLRPAAGTFATVDDVAARWGQTPSDAEAALIDIRLADVERMIERRIPTLRADVVAGRIAKADVVQVEAEVVLRLMRNPEGFVSETDGDYSYQRARELSTGRLNILDEEWEALGFRRSRMSILVPEPMVEQWSDTTAAAAVVAAAEYIVANEAALLKKPATTIAVTRDTAQLWMFDPTSRKANPNGWVPVGAAGSSVKDGLVQGQLLSWDARYKKWLPNKDTVASGDGYTLVWSNAKSSWTVSANRLQDLTDVSGSARRGGGALQSGDMLEYDDASKRWVAVAPSDFVSKIVLGRTVAVGDMLVFNGSNWVNTAGYTKADVDQKLSNVVSGLARKPAVQAFLDKPPVSPVIGQNYIIATAPIGVWAGHANEVTFWDGSQWIFEPPLKGDTHTNLTDNQAMTWNGTAWVSLGSQASALKDLSGVKLTTPATAEVLTFDGTDWINKAIPVPPFPSLDQLTDVDVAAAADTNVLMFEGASGTWKPTVMPAGTLATLKDVALAVPANGDVLMFDTSAKAWVGKAPNLVTSPLDGLVDVDATDPDNGDMLVFDDVSKTWISSKSLTVDELELPGGLVEQLVEDTDDAFDDTTAVPNVAALRKYVAAEKSDIRLEELTDCTELSGAVAGQVPVWSDTNDRWEPSIPTQSLKGLSDVLLNTPTDKTVLSYQTLTGKWEAWGLSLDELADCNDLSAATDGQVVSWDDTRKQWVPVSPVRGGGTFASLTDVDVTTVPPVDGQSLKFNGTTSKWEPVAAPYSKTEVDTKVAPLATKVELDSKVQTLVTGLEHGVAAQSLTNTPPTNPVADEFYIVGAAGTGVWAGHNNAVTYWNGTAWQFSTPQANETHLVEDQQATFHWNGTAWVKVASAAVGGPSAIGDLWAVGSIQQSLLTEGQFRTAMGLNSAEDRKWVLADGRDVTGSQYHTITGHDHVPDLRGAFLRMAGTNAGNTSWVGGALMAWQEDNTARPKTAFTTDSQGSHTHNVWSRRMSQYSGAGYSAALGTLSEGINAGGTVSTDGRFMDPDGAHTHTITGGGDTETRPKNMSVSFYIKVN